MSWFITRTAPQRMKRVKGLLRAGAYVFGLSAVFGVLQVRSARAEMADRTVTLGREMLTLANASEHEVNRVVINGQPMWLGNSIAHDSGKNILDRYEAYCQKNAAQPAETWRELANAPPAPDSKEESKVSATGVMRGGSDREGSVLCFTKTPKSKQSLTEAMKTFAETGDLGSLGAARYAYVKTTEKGNTHVLTAWTDDTFSIFDLVGDEKKDVPGVDFGGDIPRVPDSRRAFSARLDESPFGVNVYHSNEAPKKVVGFYDGVMQGAGWAAIDPELEHREDGGHAVARLYEKNNVVLTVASTPMSDDPKEGSFTVLGLAGASGPSVRNGKTADAPDSESGASSKNASFQKKE
jgi:hypothetical protein